MSPPSPESSPSKTYDGSPSAIKSFQGASPGLTSSRRRHSLTTSRELLSGTMASSPSLTPVLEHKPDLSSHLPPAFSLGIIAGGEPGPPAPLLATSGGVTQECLQSRVGSFGGRGCAREAEVGGKSVVGGGGNGWKRLPQLLAWAALMLAAVMVSLAVWPHGAGGVIGPGVTHGEVLYAAGGLAGGVDPTPQLPRRWAAILSLTTFFC